LSPLSELVLVQCMVIDESPKPEEGEDWRRDEAEVQD